MSRVESDYDGAYRRLFGHGGMVLDLLRWFAPGAVREWVDPAQGVMALNANHSAEEGQRREGDRTFLVGLRGEGAGPGRPPGLVVRVEFQSTVQSWMELRGVLYGTLAWQELQAMRLAPDRRARRGHLLPLLPAVLYNGAPPWLRARSLRSRVELGGLGELARYQPDGEVFVLDIRRLRLPEQTRGPCDVLFKLEQLRDDPQEGGALLRRLLVHLPPGEDDALREEFRSFILEVLSKNGVGLPVEAVQTLEGVVVMFEQSIARWKERQLEEGVEVGRLASLVEAVEARLEVQLEPRARLRLIEVLRSSGVTVGEVVRAPVEVLASWVAG